MTSPVEEVSSVKAHGGRLIKYTFHSSALGGLDTKFNLYLPDAGQPHKRFPILYYLAGLTGTEDTGPQKGAFLKEASKQGLALVFPDTSPRNAKIDGEEDDWDFGTGAGFYLNATHPKWSRHYQMEKLITEELPMVLTSTPHPLDVTRQSIFGHSMGGHGALTLYLNHPDKYKSCSAFAPIMNPTKCSWGQKAFAGPGGDDGYLAGGIQEGKKYDATELVQKNLPEHLNLLVDYGDCDQFYKSGQLLPENFLQAIQKCPDLKVQVQKQFGYDHSYYFVSTFAESHIEFHSKFLNAPSVTKDT